jgi:hypothetical protein
MAQDSPKWLKVTQYPGGMQKTSALRPLTRLGLNPEHPVTEKRAVFRTRQEEECSRLSTAA